MLGDRPPSAARGSCCAGPGPLWLGDVLPEHTFSPDASSMGRCPVARTAPSDLCTRSLPPTPPQVWKRCAALQGAPRRRREVLPLGGEVQFSE